MSELFLPSQSVVVVEGEFDVFIDGQYMGTHKNLVPNEGLRYFLEVGLLGQTAASAFYLALFNGNVQPAANWTAANFASNAAEIVSTTEGYSNATRPEWVRPTSISTPVVGNDANPAQFNIVCTSTLNVTGAALLTSNVRGGTSGKLISASRFSTTYTLNNGAVFSLVYRVRFNVS